MAIKHTGLFVERIKEIKYEATILKELSKGYQIIGNTHLAVEHSNMASRLDAIGNHIQQLMDLEGEE